MQLLSSLTNGDGQADAWTAQATFSARADDVLRALTDPRLIALWAPVDFEVDGLAGGQLTSGSSECVRGTIAGVQAKFDVQVARADLERLELVARGPVSFDVAYSFHGMADGVTVRACVSLRRERGLRAQMLRTIAAGLLSAGALSSALSRLEASLPCPAPPELLAA